MTNGESNGLWRGVVSQRNISSSEGSVESGEFTVMRTRNSQHKGGIFTVAEDPATSYIMRYTTTGDLHPEHEVVVNRRNKTRLSECCRELECRNGNVQDNLRGNIYFRELLSDIFVK